MKLRANGGKVRLKWVPLYRQKSLGHRQSASLQKLMSPTRAREFHESVRVSQQFCQRKLLGNRAGSLVRVKRVVLLVAVVSLQETTGFAFCLTQSNRDKILTPLYFKAMLEAHIRSLESDSGRCQHTHGIYFLPLSRKA